MFDITVAFARVNVRRGPGINYATLERLGDAGLVLQAVGRSEDGEWVQICCVTAGNGWISADVINTSQNIQALRIAERPPTLAIIEASALNVRSGPQIAFESIGIVEAGESYEIIAQNEVLDWYKICCVDGQTGWVYSESVRVDGDIDAIPVETR